MRHQPQVVVSPDQSRGLPVFSVLTDRHQAAINELRDAFAKQRTVALLVGDGNIETSHVVSAFHASLPEDVTVVRLKHPHSDALSAMQHINRALGFEPQNLCLSDLRNILIMFLQYQKQNQRRTLLCVEQADQQAVWLLDTIESLFNTEELKNCGLSVLLSGGTHLCDAAEDTPLGCMRSYAGPTVRLAPFTIKETRDFVRQRVEATGAADVSRVFEFDAVDRLHRLSGGRSDTVAKLCHESLLMADLNRSRPVSAKTVTKAARGLHLESSVDLTLAVVNNSRAVELAQTQEVLVSRWNDGSVREIPLTKGRFMVGRAKTVDILLPSPKVSRRHALLIRTAEHLQVLDLDSSNGTFVKDRQVKEYNLEAGDVLTMGDCKIEYLIRN